jgi:hypothetical protein
LTPAKLTDVAFVKLTDPVNDGLDKGAFNARDAAVADEIGLFASEVLSTFDNPTIDFVIPDTVPVNVGDASGAFVPTKVVNDVPAD